MLRAAYAYLAETPPFNGWNLPDQEDIEFRVTNTNRVHGELHTLIDENEKFKFTIDISRKGHTHTASLILTMAHEMVHVHQRHNRINVTSVSHGKDFKILAKEVCDEHGFDPGQF
jgi:3-hydroxy-3-methylglutaryl CoA synthase